MRAFAIGAALLTAVSVAAAQGPSAKHTAPAGKTIVVTLIDKSATEYAFEPASYTAHPGDIIRFVQTAAMPHNVAFKSVPAGVDIATLPPSDILVTKGQVYELKIDGRFKNGTYQVICQPHEAMQMKSTLTITGAQ